ncbi:MAG TPA: winged helix-turn-helix transcriptional regulator [Candidatus Thermoplasmatota archaeon]|nr:winged helix-turn-helix transcriptional regulator [Candidatus Thermoplasmatota archaeon]
MPKNRKESFAEDEIKVLTILEQQGKNSINEIMKRTGFSRQKVGSIIKHLENKKIIWGYTTITDGTLKNQKHFIVLLRRIHGVRLSDEFRKEMAFDRLDNYPKGLVEIENIYYTHGSYDMIISFYAPTLISAKNFLDHTIQRYQKYVKEYTLLETMFPIRIQRMKNPNIEDLVNYI